MYFVNLTLGQNEKFGFEEGLDEGKVTHIRDESPADKSKMKRGDQIFAINRKPIINKGTITNLIQQSHPSIALSVYRRGTILMI